MGMNGVSGGGNKNSGGGGVSGGSKNGGVGGAKGGKCTTTVTNNSATKTTTSVKSCGIAGFKSIQGIDTSKFSADKLSRSLDAKTKTAATNQAKSVKNATALSNAKLAQQIKQLNPKGANRKVNKKTGKIADPGGVASSRKSAKRQAAKYLTPTVKSRIEAVAKKYGLSPALLAGIASRESGFGAYLSKKGINSGWGDYGKRKGEKTKQYHGFGIMQVDKNTGGTKYAKTLKSGYGKTKLDPYSLKNIEAGAEVFSKKLAGVQAKYPNLSEARQIATAVSKYNGGKGLAYPKSDKGTTGGDYANDTLARAGWFAGNWGSIGN
jgi:hypothetical protein